MTTHDPSPATSGHVPRIVVSDFDGTMTRTDFFELARSELPSAATRDYWEAYVAGELSHFEALAAIFASIRTDEKTLDALIERMHLDGSLPSAVGRLRRSGWELVIASAGCSWYIYKLLRGAHLDIEVHANPGTFSPEKGLQLSLPQDSPYFGRETGIDKVAVVRAALARSACVAFAGDGRPDLEPAMLVPPARRFARGWLAHALEKRNEPFRSFEDWTDLANQLLGETTS